MNFIKIQPLGVKLFHVDWQTDMTKLIVAFRNFADSSKKGRERSSRESDENRQKSKSVGWKQGTNK
jgi:hypothetical protein